MKDVARFYSPLVETHSTLDLSEEEHRHAKVLRLAEGEEVHVVDGKGSLFQGKLQFNKKQLHVRVSDIIQSEAQSKRPVTLAVAPTKNINRFEWIIEKASELGVQRIVPIKCSQSERLHLKTDRLVKIAVSAMKQSKSLWLTEIDELKAVETIWKMEASARWIAHCSDGPKLDIHSLSDCAGSQIICIGPEGDFSTSEIDQALEAGFSAITLGDLRLRTETAAISACVAANLFHQ
jgi:16S rRNA (uracil1498-N3)-methyltransferase